MIGNKGRVATHARAALCVGSWLMACGNVEHDDQTRGPTAVAGSTVDSGGGPAGRSSGGSGNAPGASNPPAAGNPSSAGGSAGTVNVATGGSMSAVGGNPAAPIATRWPLITGDPGCPPWAPVQLTCDAQIACVYPGLETALKSIEGEHRCACLGKQWWCLLTEPGIATQCPLGPGDEAPCRSGSDVTCVYRVPGQAWSASCFCRLPEASEQSEGGAGGAAGNGAWACGL